MELHHVLCPVDFSESTDVGVRTGLAIGGRFGARVTLLHVLPALQSPFRVPIDIDDLYEQWNEEAGERLQEVVRQARAAGVPVTAELGHGSAIHEIVRFAEHAEADLIVIPTHSRAGLDRLLHGSVAQRVLRIAEVPVLTVPPAIEGAGSFEPRRVMLATDFSPSAESAFQSAVEVADAYGAELMLAHVFTFEHVSDEGTDWWRPTLTRDQVEEALADVTGRLEKLAGRARRRGVDTSIDLTQGANPAAEIVRLVEEEGVDLLVAAKHGGLLRHLLLGSTAEKLARSCPVPLLTVPAVEDGSAGGTIPDPVPA